MECMEVKNHFKKKSLKAREHIVNEITRVGTMCDSVRVGKQTILKSKIWQCY
jgi:hypothetical protein